MGRQPECSTEDSILEYVKEDGLEGVSCEVADVLLGEENDVELE